MYAPTESPCDLGAYPAFIAIKTTSPKYEHTGIKNACSSYDPNKTYGRDDQVGSNFILLLPEPTKFKAACEKIDDAFLESQKYDNVFLVTAPAKKGDLDTRETCLRALRLFPSGSGSSRRPSRQAAEELVVHDSDSDFEDQKLVTSKTTTTISSRRKGLLGTSGAQWGDDDDGSDIDDFIEDDIGSGDFSSKSKSSTAKRRKTKAKQSSGSGSDGYPLPVGQIGKKKNASAKRTKVDGRTSGLENTDTDDDDEEWRKNQSSALHGWLDRVGEGRTSGKRHNTRKTYLRKKEKASGNFRHQAPGETVVLEDDEIAFEDGGTWESGEVFPAAACAPIFARRDPEWTRGLAKLHDSDPKLSQVLSVFKVRHRLAPCICNTVFGFEGTVLLSRGC